MSSVLLLQDLATEPSMYSTQYSPHPDSLFLDDLFYYYLPSYRCVGKMQTFSVERYGMYKYHWALKG